MFKNCAARTVLAGMASLRLDGGVKRGKKVEFKINWTDPCDINTVRMTEVLGRKKLDDGWNKNY